MVNIARLGRLSMCLTPQRRGHAFVLLYLICHLIRSVAFLQNPRSLFRQRDSSLLSSPHETSSLRATSLEPTQIEGLVENFDMLCSIHETLQELRTQLPSLLVRPLSSELASRTYTKDTRLLVADRELVVSREELLSLSNALFLAVQTPLRASSFLGQNASSFVEVECEIYLDPTNLSEVEVQWEAELFPLLGRSNESPGSNNLLSKIEGISELHLDDDSGKIASHRLVHVRWNGQDQDEQAIGQALSTLRQTFLNLQQTPVLQTFLGESSSTLSLLNQWRDDLIQQLAASTESTEVEMAPLLVNVSTDIEANRTNATLFSGIPIDDYLPPNETSKLQAPAPLPGSSAWNAYAASHRALVKFVEKTIPVLAGDEESVDSFQSFFAPGAKLKTVDGSLLLEGAGRLANFYESLGALRKRTFGTWSLQNATALEWKGSPRIRIDYSTSIQVPGASASTVVSGSDTYILSETSADLDDKRLILEVRQESLSIGSIQSKQDAIFFMRSLATAVETGRFRSGSADSVWMEIFERLTANGGSSSVAAPKLKLPPPRSDAAAVTVYRIMTTFHRDLQALVDTNVTSHLPPCSEYITENIQLLGYLSENLLRGRSLYSRNIGLSIASLKAALRSGRVVCEKEPSVHVELTAQGNVRVSLELRLKLVAWTGFPGMESMATAGGIPLKICLVSEYVLDPETGRIVQHQLIESRVNGQLTPGDIVSRWFQRQRGEAVANGDNESMMKVVTDTLSWLRSLNRT